MKAAKLKSAKRRTPARKASGLAADLVRPKEGVVNSQIFTDPEIHRLEMERIFTRSWLYVAHESEIPQPGDFVTRTMGDDPVIGVTSCL